MSFHPPPAQRPQGPGAPYQAQQVAPRKPRNVLGIVALVTAIVGAIFAAVEGAYIVGWLLLPIAFVLSLAALFQKAPKGTAIAALIVTLVGTVVGAVAFLGSLSRAFEGIGGGTVSAAPSAPGVSAPAGTAPTSTQSSPASARQGSRDNPYPVGATVSNDRWQVKVNSFTPNATKSVLAENQFNKKPDAGLQYSLANISATNLSDDSASPAFDIQVSYVTASGNVVNSSDATAVAPKALSPNELYKGASATGNVVLLTPQGDGGLVRVRIGMIGGDEVFFSLK